MMSDPRWKPQPYHEIFTIDCYRLKRISPAPSAVIDIGANYGCFTHYAKHLWPNCRVVAIEPHPTNFAVCQELVNGKLDNVHLINAAMATSPPHWLPAAGGESNPGGQIYMCECVGYDQSDLSAFTPASCPAIRLCDLKDYLPPDGNYVVKIDCEGGEQCLFDDKESTQILSDAKYFTAELHFFAGRYRFVPEEDRHACKMLQTHGHVIRAFMDWMYAFSETHVVEIEITNPNSGMMWATRK